MALFPTLLLAASAALAQGKDSGAVGPAARKAGDYVRRFVDPISEALTVGASRAASALGSADPSAPAPILADPIFPDPLELLKATFVSEPEVRAAAPRSVEPTAKPSDFTYRPPAERRRDSLRLVRHRGLAPRPRLKTD